MGWILLILVRRMLFLVLLLVLLAVLVGAGWGLTHREQVRSWRQAATVAAQLAKVDVATRVLGMVDDEPGRAFLSSQGGLPATTIAPVGGGRHPAIVLLIPNATTPAELGDLVDVQRALAHAGIAAWALRTPDPGRALGDARDLSVLVHALDSIRHDPRTAGGRISIAAGGALASQALVATTVAPLRGHVRGVLAVQPVADVQGLVRLAVTGFARGSDGSDAPHPAAAALRRVAGRALVEALQKGAPSGSGAERRLLDGAAASDDPIGALSVVPRAVLTPDLARARDVLTARDPAQFDAAWALLPAQIRAQADARSPIAAAPRVRARVLLVTPRNDSQYPSGDADRLARAINGARVRSTSLLNPGAQLPGSASSAELRQALSVSAWWLQRAGG